jgi:hypothetical protein
MCWVALDRAARLAARRGRDSVADRWREVANEIHADVCDRGVDERGVFVQHYDTVALDASTLLIPLVRFLPGEDPRVRATVLAIEEELGEQGLSSATGPTDRRRSWRCGGGHLPDLLVLAGLGAARDRRAPLAAARCASGCSRSPRRSTCSPRNSMRAAAVTSATSPRPSPTSR